MRKLILTGIAVILIFAGGGGYFFNIYIPARARAYTAELLKSAGFTAAVLPEGQIRFNAARFDNINLDSEGLNKIRRVEILYNPITLAFAQTITEAKIDGISLTGEITKAAALDIPGWSKPVSSLRNLKLKTFSIVKSSLAVLTDEIGGISISFDAQLRLHDKGAEFRGSARSAQRRLSFNALASGNMNTDGLWQTEIEIDKGKFETSPLRANRISGKAFITDSEDTAPEIISELSAGGFSVYDYPWQNAEIAMELKNGIFSFFSDMKSVGVDGLELSLSINSTPEGRESSGRIHAEKLGTLEKYLEKSGALPDKIKSIKSKNTIENVVMDLITPIGQKEKDVTALPFILKDSKDKTLAAGELATVKNKKP